jgi:hypothetical protein
LTRFPISEPHFLITPLPIRESPEGAEQVIAHLINSPVAEETDENLDCRVRPPVLDVKVTCRSLDGRAPRQAWLLMAEPTTPAAEPAVQALPLKLTPQEGARPAEQSASP